MDSQSWGDKSKKYQRDISRQKSFLLTKWRHFWNSYSCGFIIQCLNNILRSFHFWVHTPFYSIIACLGCDWLYHIGGGGILDLNHYKRKLAQPKLFVFAFYIGLKLSFHNFDKSMWTGKRRRTIMMNMKFVC